MKHLKKLSTSFMLFAALLGLAQGFATAPPATPAPTKVENPGDFNFNFYATTNAVGFLLLPALALAAQIAHKGLKSGLETKNPEPLPLKELLKFSGKNMWSALKTSKNWKQPFADFAAIFTRPERSKEIQTRKEATKALTAHVLAQLKAFVAKNPGINASLVAAVINFAYSLKQKSNHTQAAQEFAAYTKALAAHTESEKLRIAAEAEAKRQHDATTLKSLKKTFYEIKRKNHLKSLIKQKKETVRLAAEAAAAEKAKDAERKRLADAESEKLRVLNAARERTAASEAKKAATLAAKHAEQAASAKKAAEETERQRVLARAREWAAPKIAAKQEKLRLAAETEARTRDAARAAQQEIERHREAAARALAEQQRTEALAAQQEARERKDREATARANKHAEQNRTVWTEGTAEQGNIRPGKNVKGLPKTIERCALVGGKGKKSLTWVTLDQSTEDYEALHKLCYPEKPGLWAQGLGWLSSWRR